MFRLEFKLITVSPFVTTPAHIGNPSAHTQQNHWQSKIR